MSENRKAYEIDDATEYVGGDYLKKAHLAEAKLLTILDVEAVTIKGDDGREREKLQLTVQMGERELKHTIPDAISNFLIATFGKRPSSWLNQEVVAYVDLGVNFKGNVGGIRYRLPRRKKNAPDPTAQPPPPPHPPPPGEIEGEDESEAF